MSGIVYRNHSTAKRGESFPVFHTEHAEVGECAKRLSISDGAKTARRILDRHAAMLLREFANGFDIRWHPKLMGDEEDASRSGHFAEFSGRRIYGIFGDVDIDDALTRGLDGAFHDVAVEGGHDDFRLRQER